MFPPTQPNDNALMRVSDFQRQHADDTAEANPADTGTTRLSALNPSLLQDLQRFERQQRPGEGLDVLEVLAAALRHGRALLLHLQLDYRVIPLIARPGEHQLQCPLSLSQLLALRLPDLRVLRVEPAPPADAPHPADEPPLHTESLGQLLWELALRGAREELLPEIAGVAAYRVTPGADLSTLDLSGSLAAAVARLRQQTSPLREIAGWPGFDRGRAMRMLNGLYLQAALMVTRTHPGAIGG